MPNKNEILPPDPGAAPLSYEEVNILLNYQKLWIEVVVWMRNLFHSTLENLPDLAAVTNRVFQKMPMDFYNEFRKSFGPAESQQLLDIISRLVATNWQMINAYKANNQPAIDASLVQWYRVVDEAAIFFNSVNEYWDANQIRVMMNDYIQSKIQEIIAFLSGDYEMEIRVFDEIEKKAARLAAYMAMGIIAKRPRPQIMP